MIVCLLKNSQVLPDEGGFVSLLQKTREGTGEKKGGSRATFIAVLQRAATEKKLLHYSVIIFREMTIGCTGMF